MKIKTPHFWYRQKSTPPPFIEYALQPLSALYNLGNTINQSQQQTQKAKIPVICVGNITAGGSGKTPSCIALHALIDSENIANNAYFLTRGYGGSNKSTRCITGQEGANETGDEPLLLSKHAETIVSMNRYNGAIHACELGAELIIMDDGFQNQTLYKDLSFLIVDGSMGFGNGKTLPSGPLRESVEHAIKRADAIIFIGKDRRGILPEIKSSSSSLPVFLANITAQTMPDKERPYIGFAGLGHPDKFKDTLLDCGTKLIDFIPFADHYPYSNADMDKLIKQAQNNNAQLITTEKDILRIPPPYRAQIQTLPIKVEFESPNLVADFLKDRLNSPINE
ncbi:MAG: tetraacyldisaccharide 4'-kinase [Alphaproteobacteria bacterium]